MKTISKFLFLVGIACSTLSVWADNTAEKAALEQFFSWRGTDYNSVLVEANDNSELVNCVNRLYKNSFVMIDKEGNDYIFQVVFSLNGLMPEMEKTDTIYVAKDVKSLLGETAIKAIKEQFKKEYPMWKDELKKCAGAEAPARMISNGWKQPDPLFGEVPFRINGIQNAATFGFAYMYQRVLQGGNIVSGTDPTESAKCALNSDVYLKSLSRMMDVFQTTAIYQLAKAHPMIYGESLAKAKRLGVINKDTNNLFYICAQQADTKLSLNKRNALAPELAIQTSLDRMAWKDYTWDGLKGDTLTLSNVGDSIFFRAKNLNATLSDDQQRTYLFAVSDTFITGGRLISLFDKTCVLDSAPEWAFSYLFSECPTLIDASQLILPNRLSANSYTGMFKNCAALRAVPSLPATQLAEGCYSMMFQGCSSLETEILGATCHGTSVTFPTEGAEDWNKDMFTSCHVYDSVQLGNSYCIGLWQGPRAVTLTSIDSSRVYDATPLTADSVIISGYKIDADLITFSVTGTQTEVGSSENIFTYSLTQSAKAVDYTFSTVYGTLTVDYISREPIKVMIDSLSKPYDGTPLVALNYRAEGLIGNDQMHLTFDTTTTYLINAGYQLVQPHSFAILRGDVDVTHGYIVAPIQPGLLHILPRQIVLQSADSCKPYDTHPLTCDKVSIVEGDFINDDGVICHCYGSQTKVGQSDNVFDYTFKEGTLASNYTIIQRFGTLAVTVSIFPHIEGMYDKWNIVLHVNQLEEDLAKLGIYTTIDPDNVSWYIVNGETDAIDYLTGMVRDDYPAIPFSGFFHAENTQMNGQYYAVVSVPAALIPMGVKCFQSNVVFVDAKKAAKSSNEMQESDETIPDSKFILNGQLIIVKDGQMYNAQGQAL